MRSVWQRMLTAAFDGLLTVCFGSGSTSVFHQCFTILHHKIVEQFRPRANALAVTSKHVRAALCAAGAVLPSPGAALEELARSGCRRVLVASLFLANGREYQALHSLCRAQSGQFERLVLTPPLLECAQSRDLLAQVLLHLYPPAPGTGVVLLGHGEHNGLNSAYAQLNLRLHRAGRPELMISLLHGSPTPAQAAAALRVKGIANARLGCLMLCAGHHWRQALAEGGAKTALEEAGLALEVQAAPLGESPAVRVLFLQHITQTASAPGSRL